jgi:hypothetical protein
VRAVLGKEQRAGDDEESKHHEPCSRCQEAALRLTFMLRVIVHRHRALLFDNQASVKHAHRASKQKFFRLLCEQLHGNSCI